MSSICYLLSVICYLLSVFCYLLSSIQNLESVTQKMEELPLDAPEPPPPLTNFFLIICWDSPYELPCKIWGLYLCIIIYIYIYIYSVCPIKRERQVWFEIHLSQINSKRLRKVFNGQDDILSLKTEFCTKVFHWWNAGKCVYRLHCFVVPRLPWGLLLWTRYL